VTAIILGALLLGEPLGWLPLAGLATLLLGLRIALGGPLRQPRSRNSTTSAT
jgi:drug/metabolite transporter (DMT)-like permease